MAMMLVFRFQVLEVKSVLAGLFVFSLTHLCLFVVAVLKTLRELGVETSILTDPSQFPEQVRAAALKPPTNHLT